MEMDERIINKRFFLQSITQFLRPLNTLLSFSGSNYRKPDFVGCLTHQHLFIPGQSGIHLWPGVLRSSTIVATHI